MILRKKCIKLLEDDTIEENYTGRQTSSYVGLYSTNGRSCNCSWFGAHLFCRHIIFYRKMKNLPIFEVNIFHKSFLSKRFADSVEAEACSIDIDEDDVDIDDEYLDNEDNAPPASP